LKALSHQPTALHSVEMLLILSSRPHELTDLLETPVGCAPTPTPPQYFRAQLEQLGAFVQTSYKFNWGGSVATLY